MDKKHNNLAQPESEWMMKKKKDVTQPINPHDHAGIKMNAEEVKPK